MFIVTDKDNPDWFAWGIIYQYIMPQSESMSQPELNAELPYYYGAKMIMEGRVAMEKHYGRNYRNDIPRMGRED